MIVLDACGIGALPDAADYGDAGTDTLGHLGSVTGGLELPTLARLGLGSIAPIEGVPPAEQPVVHGRLHPLGPGKDSTAGHWELMGVVQSAPLPTYPDGFPPEVVELIASAAGHEVLCNRPSNGIEAIEAYGTEHLRTGSPIVYTSQDSVLQIAAHVDVLAPAELYAICAGVRERLPPEHAVGRVIARPFDGSRRALSSHRRAPRLLDRTAGPELSGRAPRRRRRGQHGRQGRPAVRGARRRRRAPRRHQRHRARADHAAARDARPRARVHEPDRDRPGLRAPARRRGLPSGAARDRRARRPAGCSCSATTTCWS